jgi:hypothetical protein
MQSPFAFAKSQFVGAIRGLIDITTPELKMEQAVPMFEDVNYWATALGFPAIFENLHLWYFEKEYGPGALENYYSDGQVLSVTIRYPRKVSDPKFAHPAGNRSALLCDYWFFWNLSEYFNRPVAAASSPRRRLRAEQRCWDFEPEAPPPGTFLPPPPATTRIVRWRHEVLRRWNCFIESETDFHWHRPSVLVRPEMFPQGEDAPLHEADVSILRCLGAALHSLHLEDLAHKTELSEKNLRSRLRRLRSMGFVGLPFGDRGGWFITLLGKRRLGKLT